MEKWYGRRGENRKLKMGVEKSGEWRVASGEWEERFIAEDAMENITSLRRLRSE
jgi:hypothetical protein